jgi:hypothetical protein
LIRPPLLKPVFLRQTGETSLTCSLSIGKIPREPFEQPKEIRMKRLLLVSLLVFGLAAFAVGQGAGGGAATPQRGAAARGGGMPAPPAPTGPVADMATAQIEAINKGDAAFF